VLRRGMGHDQSSAVVPCQLPQLRVQFNQRFQDELDAAVPPRQGVQDRAVEDENAVDMAAGLERVEQRGIVAGPQVTPKPHQS
jgi:hypothetical protein